MPPDTQQFQTSFIPKEPLSKEREQGERPRKRQGIGALLLLSFFVLVLSLLFAGGVFLFKGSIIKQVASSKDSLERSRASFEPALLEDLQTLDKRINATQTLLRGHVVLTPIFELLGDITLPSVRYTQFGYNPPSQTSRGITVDISGEARNYTAIAIQSKLFGEHRSIIDPIFSNLSLDVEGNVLFDLSFEIKSDLVSFDEVIVRSEPMPIIPDTILPEENVVEYQVDDEIIIDNIDEEIVDTPLYDQLPPVNLEGSQ